MTAVPSDFVDLALSLAEAARPVIRTYFRAPIAIDDKADDSPVTIADREVEAAMRAILAAKVPGHGILGEEHGRENCGAEWVWVLDPIDGTMSFITGVPTFGTLISLFHNGRPVLGIIDQAISDERWLGVAGRPTTWNGQPVKARPCPAIGAAYAFTTAPELFKPHQRPAWDRVAAKAKRTRYGADCYAYALVASGCVDLVVEAGLKPYDFGALIPVIQGAGGIMTDWSGGALTIESDGSVCAAGDARVHAQALELLAS